MKYTIPSKGRSELIGNVLDLLGTTDTLVYVYENERDDYLKYMSKDNLRTHNVFGIGAIRKFMYEDNLNEDYSFQFDDDITSLEYKFSDRMTLIVDPEHIRAVVDNCYYVANDIGTPLFGIAAGVGPLLYTQLDHVFFTGFVNAINTGVIPRLMGDINWDTRFNVQHEDHDLSLQVKYHKRYLFMDARYSTRSPTGNPAGLSTIRGIGDKKKCNDLLRAKYGSAIQAGRREDRVSLQCGF